MSKKIGRPSKFNEDILIKTEQFYLKYFNMGIEPESIPFLEELHPILKVDKDTVNEWKNEGNGKEDSEKKEFSVLLKKIKELQKLRLLQVGLKYPGKQIYCMFILKTHHNYVETSKQINEGNQVVIQVTKTGYVQEVTDAPKQVKLKPS